VKKHSSPKRAGKTCYYKPAEAGATAERDEIGRQNSGFSFPSLPDGVSQWGFKPTPLELRFFYFL